MKEERSIVNTGTSTSLKAEDFALTGATGSLSQCIHLHIFHAFYKYVKLSAEHKFGSDFLEPKEKDKSVFSADKSQGSAAVAGTAGGGPVKESKPAVKAVLGPVVAQEKVTRERLSVMR